MPNRNTSDLTFYSREFLTILILLSTLDLNHKSSCYPTMKDVMLPIILLVEIIKLLYMDNIYLYYIITLEDILEF